MNPPKVDIDSFWLPHAGSTIADLIDGHFYLVLGVSTVFFALVTILTIAFAVRYKRKQEGEATSKFDHHMGIEIVWTSIPLVIVLGLCGLGMKGFVQAAVAPRDSLEIRAVAQMYMWTFTYPDGTVTVNELGVPVGRPVKLLLSSKDVLHSFFVPEMRVKQDIVPGMYTSVWFEPTRAHETAIFCTEYCGSGHSTMWGTMKAMAPADYEKWLEGQSSGGEGVPPAELGAKLFASRGCNACHSLDGSRGQGPTMKGLFGRKEALEDGSEVTVDENYLRESILKPAAKVVRGYPPVMPVFQGLLKEREVDALVAYLKTLGGE